MGFENHGARAQSRIVRTEGLLVDGTSEGQVHDLSEWASTKCYERSTLRHDDGIAGLQLDSLFGLFPANYVFVIDKQFLLSRPILAQNVNPLKARERCEPTRVR